MENIDAEHTYIEDACKAGLASPIDWDQINIGHYILLERKAYLITDCKRLLGKQGRGGKYVILIDVFNFSIKETKIYPSQQHFEPTVSASDHELMMVDREGREVSYMLPDGTIESEEVARPIPADQLAALQRLTDEQRPVSIRLLRLLDTVVYASHKLIS